MNDNDSDSDDGDRCCINRISFRLRRRCALRFDAKYAFLCFSDL